MSKPLASSASKRPTAHASTQTETTLVSHAEASSRTSKILHDASVQACAVMPATYSTSSTSTSASSLETKTPPPPLLLRAAIDWTEDAASILIRPLAAPHDFSILRSDAVAPFETLEKRVRRRRAQRPPHSNSHHKFNQQTMLAKNTKTHQHPLPAFITRRHPLGIAPDRPVFIIWSASLHAPSMLLPSILGWGQDPRLADLSRALYVLGWVRP